LSLSFATVFFVAIKNSAEPFPSITSLSDTPTVSSQAVSFYLKATNEYGDVTVNMSPYPFLEDSLFIEPYKATTVSIIGSLSTCQYDWSVTSSDSVVVANGNSGSAGFSLTLTAVGQYRIAVKEHRCVGTGIGAAEQQLVQDVWVKYVRRELSSLTDADREAFLNAYHTLWQVDTLEGQQRYGKAYKSLYYLAIIHNDGAANPICDDFHGDIGKLNSLSLVSMGLYTFLSLRLCEQPHDAECILGAIAAAGESQHRPTLYGVRQILLRSIVCLP
jgi:hypothetical protein